MYGYIYKTTNIVNGRLYIGQKKSEIFLKEEYLGSGTALKNAVSYYGSNNFRVELIEECKTKEELDIREIYWIKFYRGKYGKKKLYNISDGGNWWNEKVRVWNKGKTLSEETKKKISESTKKAMKRPDVREKVLKRNDNYLYGNNHAKGHKLSDEQKEFISKRTKEGMNKPDIRKNFLKAIKESNFHHDPVWLEKQSLAHRGRIHINNGVIQKSVFLNDYEENYDKSIWNKGNLNIPTCWITNGKDVIRVKVKDYEENYDKSIWRKGRKKKKEGDNNG